LSRASSARARTPSCVLQAAQAASPTRGRATAATSRSRRRASGGDRRPAWPGACGPATSSRTTPGVARQGGGDRGDAGASAIRNAAISDYG
jgi:hypothetical protein